MSYENKSQYEDGRRSSGRGRGQASWKVYNHGPQHFGNERQSNMKSYSNANAGRYPDRLVWNFFLYMSLFSLHNFGYSV